MRRRPRHALLVLPLLLAAAAALLTLAQPAHAAAAAADAAAPGWAPLRLMPGRRAGLHGRRRTGTARLLRESAYVLDGSTRAGYYTAPMQLGSPPRTFHLILDSGSGLTVIPCRTCDCGFHESPPFDPNTSDTSQALTCGDRSCPFFQMYAEGSSSGGVVLRDTLLLPRPGNATPEALPGFAFGCANFQTGQLYTQQADGVLGLNHGPSGLPTQIAAAPGRRGPASVSICLGRRGGAMAVGRPARPGGATMQFVGLLPSAKGYYLLPVEGLWVGGEPLGVEQSEWNPTGASLLRSAAGRPTATVYPILVDTGATFSYFATTAYTTLLAKLAAALQPFAPRKGPAPAPSPGAAAGGPPRRAGSDRPLPGRRRRGLLQQQPPWAAPGWGGLGSYDGGWAADVAFAEPAAAKGAGAAAGAPGAAGLVVTPEEDDFDDGDTCWILSGPGAAAVVSEYDLAGIFPDLELRFVGGAALKVPPQRYIHVAGRSARGGGMRVRACLGVLDGGEESILGALMMRDAVFEFDWAGQRQIGFVDADCGQLGASFAKAPAPEAGPAPVRDGSIVDSFAMNGGFEARGRALENEYFHKEEERLLQAIAEKAAAKEAQEKAPVGGSGAAAAPGAPAAPAQPAPEQR
ncbi:MAG: aspartic peptidase domain-containing protein [Monoraphidium minutum]|nr:MAG: aspartic peptidase domain-containing protein [Monoraphidium minutum]